MQNDGSTSGLKRFLSIKWTIVVICALVIIAISVVILINSGRNSTINLYVAPVDADISINGETGFTNGAHSMYPGTYDVTISHGGLESKTFTVELTPGHVTSLTTFLSGDGDNYDFYEQKSNKTSLLLLKAIASADNNITTDNDTSAESFIASFKKKSEIYEMLPIIDQTPTGHGLEYGVNYQYDTLTIEDGRNLEQCTKALCLHITDTSGKKEQFALSVIDKLGFNSNDYQIIYERISYEQD